MKKVESKAREWQHEMKDTGNTRKRKQKRTVTRANHRKGQVKDPTKERRERDQMSDQETNR